MNIHKSVHNKAVSYCQKLCRFASITPDDAGSFYWLQCKLETLGFQLQEITENGVRNLLATKCYGDFVSPKMAFVGHLDVVPTGPVENWRSPPFAAEIIEGELIARGIADMKGSIACFLAAVERLNLQLTKGTLALMITCDEEGEAEYGTRLLVEHLKKQHALPDFCLVGEPTSVSHIGDTIKVGRRGSLSGIAKIKGKAGHVAYPHLATNAAHGAAVLAAELMNLTWRKISPAMSDTSLQITGLSTGGFTDNIIPASAKVSFNVRYNLPYCHKSIVNLIENLVNQYDTDIDLHWERACTPYFTKRRENGVDFIKLVENVIQQYTGELPNHCSGGGTSDGRFIAGEHTQVLELGFKYKTIHQVNESVSIDDINQLTDIYEGILRAIFSC